MIETVGRVVAVDGEHAWVEAERTSGCQSCASSAGCGSGALAGVFGKRRVRVRALNAAGAAPGDEVTVALDEGAMLRGVTVVYMGPLLGMLAGAWTAVWLGADVIGLGGDGAAVAGAVAGFGLGLGAARAYARRWRRAGRSQPVVVARRPSAVVTVELG